MSSTDCCSQKQSEYSGNLPLSAAQIDLINELNKHFNERIETIEETGLTELLVCNLKKWINSLVENDQTLITTIKSLEREVYDQSQKLAIVCAERLEIDNIVGKFKVEIKEKNQQIEELNCKLAKQTECLNEKECIIKRLTQELDQLKCALNKLKNETGDNNCKESNSRISEMKCELNSLREEIQRKECCIKKLEEDLCMCNRKIEEFNDVNQQIGADGKSESQQVKDLSNQLTSLKAKISVKDGNVEEQLKKIKYMQDELEQKNKELAVFKLNSIPYIEEDERKQDCVKETIIKLEESRIEIERLNEVLVTMQSSAESQQLELLRKNLENMKRENRDMKEALTAEVCEKHDMITSLRRDTAQLEEKARQADMQAIFKDDIIKELRKEVKIARAKHQSETDQDIKIQVVETGGSTKILYSEDSFQVRIMADSLVASNDKTVQTITN